jgi:hypothetical protein
VLRLTASIAAAVVAAAASALLALSSARVVPLTRGQLVTAIVLVAVLAAGSTSAQAISQWRARRLGARREAADVVLDAAVWAVVDSTGIDYRDLGLAAYRVQRAWPTPWRSRLRRVHRVRAKRRPTASDVRWAPGKGVIGACVARAQVVAQDVGADYAAVWPCTREEWETGVVPEEVRLGLGYEEFLDVQGKYDVVVATPVLDDSHPATTRVSGCVALDGPAGSLDRLSTDEVLALLDSAARMLEAARSAA